MERSSEGVNQCCPSSNSIQFSLPVDSSVRELSGASDKQTHRRKGTDISPPNIPTVLSSKDAYVLQSFSPYDGIMVWYKNGCDEMINVDPIEFVTISR